MDEEQTKTRRTGGFIAALAAALSAFISRSIRPIETYQRPRRGFSRLGNRRTTHFARNGQRECERRRRQMARGARLDALADTWSADTRKPTEAALAALRMPFPKAGASLRRANLGGL